VLWVELAAYLVGTSHGEEKRKVVVYIYIHIHIYSSDDVSFAELESKRERWKKRRVVGVDVNNATVLGRRQSLDITTVHSVCCLWFRFLLVTFRDYVDCSAQDIDRFSATEK
jgi:hypothetical protein